MTIELSEECAEVPVCGGAEALNSPVIAPRYGSALGIVKLRSLGVTRKCTAVEFRIPTTRKLPRRSALSRYPVFRMMYMLIDG